MLAMLALPSQAVAQPEVLTRPALETHEPAPAPAPQSIFKVDGLQLSARDLGGRPTIVQDVQTRDSVANGILIGAAIGAAAFGTFAGIVCKVQQEPEGPSCMSDTLRIAAIGAAIGAGGGLAIDAALTRQSGVRVSLAVRF